MTAPFRFFAVLFGALVSGLAAAKEPFKPNLGPDIASFTVECGDVALMLRQASQWTPGRIDFRGQPMTTEHSAYGTVFSFPGTGFIGTGHLENEPEKLQSLVFFLDGQPVDKPGSLLKGKTFRFERKSRIRGFDLANVTEVRDGRLYETATVQTAEAQPLKLVYHFMHAWVPSVDSFLAGRDYAAAPLAKGAEAGGLGDGAEVAKKFYINDRVDWMAVHEPKSGQFAVSRLLQVPAQGGHVSMIWNVPGTYRKYYLKCFEEASVPAGFTGTWKMVTAFGQAGAEGWEAAARKLAQDLREP